MGNVTNINKTNFQPPSLTIVTGKDGRKYLEEFRELGPLLIRESLSWKDRLFGLFRRHLWQRIRVKNKSSNDSEEDLFIDMVPIHELQEEILDRTIRAQKHLNPSLLLTKKKGQIFISPKHANTPQLVSTKVFKVSEMNAKPKENSNYLKNCIFNLKEQLQNLRKVEKTLPSTSVSFHEMDVTQATLPQ
ncbi:MAG TPA: hypothetical protein VLG44_05145 [Chlamydiales bacterium]|nr:hypothetical protein [Chlamydiales bacterium]